MASKEKRLKKKQLILQRVNLVETFGRKIIPQNRNRENYSKNGPFYNFSDRSVNFN